jgi:molecular chaperone Hsp33
MVSGAHPSAANDELVIAVSRDGLLRARAARTTRACADASRRHQSGPLAAHALARALTCAALYPTSFKDCSRLSLQLAGAGPLKSVFAELREGPQGQGVLRGYTKVPGATLWAADPRGRRIGRALAPGALQLLRAQPGGGFSQGHVELTSGEVDEDLEHYFVSSEQVPTRLRTAVDVDDTGAVRAACGVLVQVLPGGDPSLLDGIDLESITPDEPPAALLARALDGAGGVVVKDTLSLELGCPCSRERALGGIALLDADEVIDMIAVDKGAEVRCEFCATVYRFTPEELLPLIETKGGDA